jgi:hypothetical protein
MSIESFDFVVHLVALFAALAEIINHGPEALERLLRLFKL